MPISLGTGPGTPSLWAVLFDPAHYQFDPQSLWHFGAALLVAVSGSLVLYWERGSRVSRYFFGFTLMFMLWALGRGVLRLLPDPVHVVVYSRSLFILIMLALPFLYQFALILVRAEARRRRLVFLHWAVGIALALASLTTPWIIGDSRQFSWGLEPIYGPLGYLSVVWVASMMAMAALDTRFAFRIAPRGSQERRRIGLFGVALAILYFAFVDFLPTMGVPVYPLAFVPILAFTVLTGYITRRYGLVEVTPQLAAQQIAGLVPGALLILDCDGVVQFANPHAEALLARPGAGPLVGASAVKRLGDAFDPAYLRQFAHLEGREAEKELVYQGPGGASRDLSLSAVAVKDEHQREVAYVCLLRDITEQKRLQQQRAAEGLRDPLTGLPSRAMFLELLEGAVRRAQLTRDYDFAVCFIGLDRLKVINEDLGYSVGDQVLAEVARRLRRVARAQDVVARLGGDEFGVLLEAAGPESIKRIAAQFQEAIAAPMRQSDHDLHLSSSIGIAASAWAYTGGAEILRDASVAMYHVKQGGGGSFHVVTQSERGTQRTRLEAELRHAIERQEFRVYYQPVLDLHERTVVGFEALVRWQHPERGIIAPGQFIEFAEKVGLIRQMDLFVMQQACADLAKFQEVTRNRHLYVSFNVGEGLMRDPHFPDEVRKCLLQHRLEPSTARIEVLERLVLVGPLRSTLNRLRELGVGLLIDDFGTGYSSLSRLHELPLTGVKIDREFVQAMGLGRGGDKMIVAIIALAQSLGYTVIAEGAGQAREARRLRDLSCRLVQGFFFSPPVPFAQALDMAREPRKAFADKHALLDATWLGAAAETVRAPGASARAAGPARGGLGTRIANWFRKRAV